jgi:hypothetical protein
VSLAESLRKKVKEEPTLQNKTDLLRAVTDARQMIQGLSPQQQAEQGVTKELSANLQFKSAVCRTDIGLRENNLLMRARNVMKAINDGSAISVEQFYIAADECMKESLDILANFHEAIEKAPSLEADSHRYMATVVSIATITQALLALNRPNHLCFDECLTRVLGESGDSILNQQKLLRSIVHTLSSSDALLSDKRSFQQLRPAIEDAKTICLDVMAYAVGVEVPDRMDTCTAAEINQARHGIGAHIRECAGLSNILGELEKVHAKAPLEAKVAGLSVESKPEQVNYVSVLAPSGLHVPAQIQADGRTAISDSNGLNFEHVDGQFRLTATAHVAEDIDTSAEVSSPARELKLTKAVEKAKALLNEDLQSQLGNEAAARKGVNHPNMVELRDTALAQQLRQQAERMGQLAGRFDRICEASDTPTARREELGGLASRLRETASSLEASASDLTRRQARWSAIKAYLRPQASLLTELLDAKHVSTVGHARALPGDPPHTTFEVKIQPRPDDDGTVYPPVYLHLHSKAAMKANQVGRVPHEAFNAVHLKSEAEKNLGTNWVNAQRDGGNHEAFVHRSPVDATLLKRLMKFKPSSL